MIRLTKLEQPTILASKSDEWTAEYRLAVESGARSTPRRWAHPEIRSQLLRETDGRCAYCESILAVTAAGDVEHILPRKHRPDLVVRWTNLTVACPVCNRGKSDYYDPECPLIHPYEDQPNDHLVFFGPFVHSKNGTERERLTIERIGLHRLALVDSRKRRIEEVEGLIHDFRRASPTLKRVIIRRIVENITGPSGFRVH
ncbi:HNH endonuclease [Dietzia cinnamea]|uniref:HNH endonuclease n=1 Tax=Dietzia cinnamea TaxID=321318 RepID=A0ABV3YNC4_9ACTN